MKNKKTLSGLAVLCTFFCSFFFCSESVAGSGDYKSMIDSMLGGAGQSGTSEEKYAFKSKYSSLEEMLTRRVEIAEQLGEEGCVLLKNEKISTNNSLPLRDKGNSTTLNVTMLGSRAYTYKADGTTLRDTSLTFYGGITGSKIVRETVKTSNGTINVPVTMEQALLNQNININPSLKTYYSNKPFPAILTGSEGSDNKGGPYAVNEPSVSLSDCGNYNNYSDAAIVVIGRCSGEGRDYLPGSAGVVSGDSQKSAIGLSKEELALIDVASEISDNVIVLVNSAIAMEIDELKSNDKVKSILWIGLPGAYGLNGVARVISGETSPSGHLADTFASNASDSPAAQNFGIKNLDGSANYTWSNSSRKDSDDSHYVVLAEDIYTGYYYYETRYADCVNNMGNATSSKGTKDGVSKWDYDNEVSYSFGYGKSYTTFEQTILNDSFYFDGENKTISLKVNVKNTGSVEGKDVVQLYVQLPYTEYDKTHKVEKSAIQLVTFDKTKLLAPNEEQTLTLTADLKYFATYDKSSVHDGVTGSYILEKGNYYFAIGNGAHESLNNILAKQGKSNDDLSIASDSVVDANKVLLWDITKNTDSFLFFDSNGVDNMYLSKSETGELIQNQLSDADYNYFKKDTVTYLSRSDWDATFPKSYTGLEEIDTMKDYLDSNVYKFTTSGSLPSNVKFGVDHSEEFDENNEPLKNVNIAAYKGKSYEDSEWDYLLQQITFDEAWKFSPYGGTKCNGFQSVNAPEVWQIDGPNGNVNRGYDTLAPTSGYLAVSKSDPNAKYLSCDMPCAPVIASTFNKELVEEEGEIFGEDTLWSRNPIMWAPGMNLHRSPFNSRNHEYYSEDPMITNIMGKSFVYGGLKKGAILSAKHFAFNTQESYREGLCQFMEEQSAREMELRAYQGLSEDIKYINEQNTEISSLGLMSSFSRVGVCGVNAHTGLMKNILRKEWGFKGLISTDMVVGGYFFNPQDSVINNVTFMATSNAENLLNSYWTQYNNKNLVKSDPNMMQALYENMHYYMYSIANSNALNGYDAKDSVSIDNKSWWQYALIGGGAVFGVGALSLFVASIYLELKKKPQEVVTNGSDNND